tara:strand:+ start:111 stop:590 length:480 start_codon:yes stop_codon:yes gene_type:complete
MSTVEERKKNRIKKIIGVIIDSNPITGISTKVSKKALSLLKGKLTKEKEFTLEGLIKDLKSEQKLSKGDRGEAESIPKKEFDESVAFTKRIRNIQRNIKPAKMPQIQNNPRDDYPQSRDPLINEKGERRIFMNMKKGGKIKTKSKYSKGGGVRPAKYKI